MNGRKKCLVTQCLHYIQFTPTELPPSRTKSTRLANLKSLSRTKKKCSKALSLKIPMRARIERKEKQIYLAFFVLDLGLGGRFIANKFHSKNFYCCAVNGWAQKLGSRFSTEFQLKHSFVPERAFSEFVNTFQTKWLIRFLRVFLRSHAGSRFFNPKLNGECKFIGLRTLQSSWKLKKAFPVILEQPAFRVLGKTHDS